MRPLTLVGRETEQGTLWAALRRVVHEQCLVEVTLSGREGCGRTRLASWLIERASELGMLGASWVVRCSEAARFRNVVAESLRLPVEPSARAAILDGMGLEPGVLDSVPSGGRDAIRSLLAVLQVVLARRPGVVLLDDEDPVAQAELALLRESSATQPIPLLVLRTREMPSRAGVQLAVEPLEEEQIASLLVAAVGMPMHLASWVAAHTGGFPMLGMRVVDDWIESGRLVPNGRGSVELSMGRRPELPRDLGGVWAERVAPLLARLGAAEQRVLHIAAVLGPVVPAAALEAAVVSEGLPPSGPILDRLVQSGLVSETELGWRFSHSLVAAGLLEPVDDRRSLHKAAAGALLATGGGAEAVGRQLAAGGAFARAAPLLVEAVEAGVLARTSMSELASLAGMALRSTPSEQDKELLSRLEYAVAERLRQVGQYARASRHATLAAERARDAGNRRREARSLVLLGWCQRFLDQNGRALKATTRALEINRELGDARAEADCVRGIASDHAALGNADLACSMLEESRRALAGTPLRTSWAKATVGLALQWVNRGRTQEGRDLLAQARPIYEELRDHAGLSTISSLLGDIARAQGDLDGARRCFEEVLRLDRMVGRTELQGTINLGIVDLIGGRDRSAGVRFERAVHIALAGRRTTMYLLAQAGLLAVQASERPNKAWLDAVENLGAQLRPEVTHPVDMAVVVRAGLERARGPVAVAALEALLARL
jgi:tetratricopeptide (TPR) repeat protein